MKKSFESEIVFVQIDIEYVFIHSGFIFYFKYLISTWNILLKYFSELFIQLQSF